jgi:hypothetical protein
MTQNMKDRENRKLLNLAQWACSKLGRNRKPTRIGIDQQDIRTKEIRSSPAERLGFILLNHPLKIFASAPLGPRYS